MFFQCDILNNLEDLGDLNTSNVTNMYCMFGMSTNNTKTGNSIIDFLPLANWDVSNVEDMAGMFQNVNVKSY
jgi:surface protein